VVFVRGIRKSQLDDTSVLYISAVPNVAHCQPWPLALKTALSNMSAHCGVDNSKPGLVTRFWALANFKNTHNNKKNVIIIFLFVRHITDSL